MPPAPNPGICTQEWPTATTAAPSTCRCGLELPKPINAYLPVEIQKGLRHHEKHWYVGPCECGSVLIWSFNNVYRQSHLLEIGRTNKIVSGGYAKDRSKYLSGEFR